MYLHIHGFNRRMENNWKKFHEIPKNKTWICHPSSTTLYLSFPGGSDSKESACGAGGLGWSLGQEDPLEKEMVTQSSILAWRIPGTEEPCRQQSMGSQRVGFWEPFMRLSVTAAPVSECFTVAFSLSSSFLPYCFGVWMIGGVCTVKLRISQQQPECFWKRI